MYRTTKKKVVKRASLSIVIALSALVAGVGAANASVPSHVTAPIVRSVQSTQRTSSTPSATKVNTKVAFGSQSVDLPEPLTRREIGS
jgi:hypothetical protein